MSYKKSIDPNNNPRGIFLLSSIFIVFPGLIIVLLLKFNKSIFEEGGSVIGLYVFSLIALGILVGVGLINLGYGLYRAYKIYRLNHILKKSSYTGVAKYITCKRVGPNKKFIKNTKNDSSCATMNDILDEIIQSDKNKKSEKQLSDEFLKIVKESTFYKIKYEYVDESGCTHEVWSIYTVDEYQKDYLEKIGFFAIEFKGKYSLITEDFENKVL